MRLRYWVVAVAAVGALTACGSGDGGTATPTTPPPGTDVLGAAPTTAATTTKPPVTKTTKPPVVAAPLTCDALKNAQVGSPTKKYNGYPDYIPLADGIWSGEDGATVELKVCAVGDLTNDGSVDGVGALSLHTASTTGTFWTIVVWKNASGQPSFYALKDLGDRNPVETIEVSGQRATVVWLTRADGEPMAQLSIRRTTIFRLSGTNLVEVSHMDVPYTP